ncbi:MAG: hypothetical protein A2046_02465 [Bacteroidetes bacterium GWA2_30_7]|nr:MAG: hypothetical protein A2046_02465 [Bacteroidetes bacterium GWA2_30_7]
METKKNIKVFIVDDDKFYSALIRHRVTSQKIEDVTSFEDGDSCISNLYQLPDIIFLDFELGDMFAPHIMNQIKIVCPLAKVVIISGQTKTQNLTECFRLGAYDYIEKNVHTLGKVEIILDELLANIVPQKNAKSIFEVIYGWLF